MKLTPEQKEQILINAVLEMTDVMRDVRSLLNIWEKEIPKHEAMQKHEEELERIKRMIERKN